ncbi:hypothetical protein ACFW2D_28070 [Streptomyces sp. NPDC058914]
MTNRAAGSESGPLLALEAALTAFDGVDVTQVRAKILPQPSSWAARTNS